MVSITSIISWINRDIFINWRKKIGNAKADKICKASQDRGTDMHTLVEHYLKNEELPKVRILSEYLFKQAKPDLNNIDNIYAIEQSMYSHQLNIAGTVDCIAEYNDELAIIDFKTSAKPKRRDWIEHYFVQCAAYACMLYEMYGIIVKKFVIIMSCENGECVVYEEYDKRKYINILSNYIREFVEFKLQEYANP